MTYKYKLLIIIPVYNEEEIISTVINDWIKILNKLDINYSIHCYNDGSTDNTKNILNELVKEYKRVKVFHKLNSGHGPSILLGYRNSHDSEWVFQVDSDNEISAKHFPDFWKKKEEFDIVASIRTFRKSSWDRRILSWGSRVTTKLIFGKNTISDVNTPFRLMRTKSFREAFLKIPSNTFAPNLVLSGYVSLKKIRFLEIPVPFTYRETGVVSIVGIKTIKVAYKAFLDTLNAYLKIRSL